MAAGPPDGAAGGAMSITEMGTAEDAERYRSLFAYSPQGVFSLDAEGRFVDANAALLEMVGWAREDLLSNSFACLVHDEDLAVFQKATVAVLDRSPQQLTTRFVGSTGRVHDVTVTAVPVVVRDQVVGVHGIAEDITESNRMYRALAEANEAKTMFLANVSHEVRTPLTMVLGATELLQESDLATKDVALVGMVHRGSQRLLRLIDDILDFSRLEAGKMALRPAPFPLARVVEEVREWADPTAASQGLRLTTSWDPALPEQVYADALRIGQVLTNLVDNALKFTESGDVHIAVTVSDPPSPADGPGASTTDVAFSVTDTGAGIEPAHLEDLFESFTQVDSSMTRTHGGVGLGLAICRDLVAVMGGHLTAVSTPTEGSAFRFVLPLVEVELEAGPSASPAPSPSRRA